MVTSLNHPCSPRSFQGILFFSPITRLPVMATIAFIRNKQTESRTLRQRSVLEWPGMDRTRSVRCLRTENPVTAPAPDRNAKPGASAGNASVAHPPARDGFCRYGCLQKYDT